MDKLIYTAMTGASHTLQQQAAVSQNLANTNTPGFRAAINTFRAVPLVGEGLADAHLCGGLHCRCRFFARRDAAHRACAGRCGERRGLDCACRRQMASEAYTRNGSFQLTPNGVLQTRSGLNVMGDTGPITIPPDTQVTIAQDGTISTVPTGNQLTGDRDWPAQADQPGAEQLVRGDDGLFRSVDGNGSRCRCQCDGVSQAIWKAAM